ncbi:MAG TPA: C40 family peptidase [Vicinamibacterales bacterium]|nr:C40 family peptidase [Vicinamibacterales bacterium]
MGVGSLMAACASTGGVPRPFPGAPTPPGATSSAPALPPAAPAPSEVISAPLIATALSYRGVPYRNGGSDPSGFDCSGFVQWVFAQEGRALPREVHDQYDVGEKIDREDVQPGDLVFFDIEGKGASHVGIALGNDQFVHAPSSRGVVRVESYTIDYWKKRYIGARRIE